jgi:hypothetical protein
MRSRFAITARTGGAGRSFGTNQKLRPRPRPPILAVRRPQGGNTAQRAAVWALEDIHAVLLIGTVERGSKVAHPSLWIKFS